MTENRELPDNYRPALESDVPEGRACGNCIFYDTDIISPDGTRAWCERWSEFVDGAFYCDSWQPDVDDDSDSSDDQNNTNGRTVMGDLEFRTFDADITEIRAAEDGQGMVFGGYAWTYGKPSLPLPFVERIAPGAFTRSLKSRAEIRAYVNHDDTLLLGSRRAGTLRIDDRADGGWVEIDLPDTSWGRDIRTLVERGDIGAKGNGGMSFGFSTVKDAWNNDGTERTLVEAKLWEVSVVTSTSAYMSTTAGMVRNVRKLAQRTATNADELAEAMTALQAGEMNENQAALLRSVVDQVSPQVVVEATTPMSVLAAKLQLAEKALGL